MAPTVPAPSKKNEKKSGKGPKKKVNGLPEKKKKGNSKRKESYQLHINKVLQQVHPNTIITVKAMAIMNSFVNDLLDYIATQAVSLMEHNKNLTLSSREIQAAARIVLPNHLAKEAVTEGIKAVTKYINSK